MIMAFRSSAIFQSLSTKLLLPSRMLVAFNNNNHYEALLFSKNNRHHFSALPAALINRRNFASSSNNNGKIRKAFKMYVDKDQHFEYEKRHTPIWRELHQVLKDHGVHNYSIFLDEEKSELFAYVEVEDEKKWENIAQTDWCKKWWTHMGDIMPSNPDDSPVSVNLKEVFHID